MQHKRATVGVFFGFLLTGLAGCPSGSAVVTRPPPAHQGVHLLVACPDQKTRDLVEAYSRNWSSQQDGQVRTIAYDPAAEPPADADLWVVRAADLPRLAKADLLRPLPDAVTGDRNATWMDLLPLYREQLVMWNLKRYGFPLLGEAPVCCYRTDRLQEAHKQPPQTWEQFADLSEYFQAHGPSGKAGPSLPPLPTDDDALEREFYTIAACYAKRAILEGTDLEVEPREEIYSFHYDLKTGKPRIDAAGFVYALKLMRDRLRPCRPVGTSADPAAEFRAGRAVLCLTDAAQVVSFQRGDLRDKFGVCRMPGGGVRFDFTTGKEKPGGEPNRMSYLGAGDYLSVVPHKASAPEAAFALAADLCGREISRQIAIEPARWGAGPIRLTQLDDTRSWSSAYDLDPERTAALRDALRQTLLHPDLRNPALRLRTPDQEAHRKVLVKALQEVLLGTADPAAALHAVAVVWTELDATNPAAHLADYLLSLGLLPN